MVLTWNSTIKKSMLLWSWSDCFSIAELLTEKAEFDSLHFYIECRDRGLINISNISLQHIPNLCPIYVNPKEGLISDEDNARIINACNNQTDCSMVINLNSTYNRKKAYANYSISYNCSTSNANSKYILWNKLLNKSLTFQKRYKPFKHLLHDYIHY